MGDQMSFARINLGGWLLIGVTLIGAIPAQAQEPFTDIEAGLLGLYYGSAVWGDYDDDGDLDILLTGTGNPFPPGDLMFAQTVLYRNDGGSFAVEAASLPNVVYSDAAWGDFDNDGDLDLLLTGSTDTSRITRIYRNDDGVLVDIAADLPASFGGSVSWADYDNDGDLDILLAGSHVPPGATEAVGLVRIYRNDAGSFGAVGVDLLSFFSSDAAWGDYDNDGDLDILIAVHLSGFNYTWLMRNDGGIFVNSTVLLPGVEEAELAWGDYDNDGDLDILMTGYVEGAGYMSSVLRNDGGSFVDIAAGLMGAYNGTVAWGDYDNDGDLDILHSGWVGTTAGVPSNRITRVYRNDNGSFVDIEAGLLGLKDCSGGWGDYDNDGDLDLLLLGDAGGPASLVYRNNTTSANTAPSPPGELTADLDGSQLILNWGSATDSQTPSSSLSYNLRVGTSPGGSEVCSPLSDPVSGYRGVVGLGNAQQNTSWNFTVTGPGPFYWSVQALDGAFAGSLFATEQVAGVISGLGDGPLARRVYLRQNTPNPFNPTTMLSFELAAAGHARLKVYDTAGSLVATLVDERRDAGSHEVIWDGRDNAGRISSAGVYLYRLEVGDFIETKRMTLVK